MRRLLVVFVLVLLLVLLEFDEELPLLIAQGFRHDYFKSEDVISSKGVEVVIIGSVKGLDSQIFEDELFSVVHPRRDVDVQIAIEGSYGNSTA